MKVEQGHGDSDEQSEGLSCVRKESLCQLSPEARVKVMKTQILTQQMKELSTSDLAVPFLGI